MISIEFERPDYCKNCYAADYSVSANNLYLDNKRQPAEAILHLECSHEMACKRMQVRANIAAATPKREENANDN